MKPRVLAIALTLALAAPSPFPALGASFDRLKFNNFLLDQGLLPPDQLAAAVDAVFVPSQRR